MIRFNDMVSFRVKSCRFRVWEGLGRQHEIDRRYGTNQQYVNHPNRRYGVFCQLAFVDWLKRSFHKDWSEGTGTKSPVKIDVVFLGWNLDCKYSFWRGSFTESNLNLNYVNVNVRQHRKAKGHVDYYLFLKLRKKRVEEKTVDYKGNPILVSNWKPNLKTVIVVGLMPYYKVCGYPIQRKSNCKEDYYKVPLKDLDKFN